MQIFSVFFLQNSCTCQKKAVTLHTDLKKINNPTPKKPRARNAVPRVIFSESGVPEDFNESGAKL